MKPEDIAFNSIQKAKTMECPTLDEQGERAAQELLARDIKMKAAMKIIVMGERLGPVTINECRWIIKDQLTVGRKLRK